MTDGYCLPSLDTNTFKFPKKIIYIKVEDENKNIIEGKNPTQISKKLKVHKNTIWDAVSKNRNHFNNYKILIIKFKNNYYKDL